MCSYCLLVDCAWDEFGDWSSCDKTCGGGEQFRERTVLTEAQNGGQNCSGEGREVKACNVHNCAGTKFYTHENDFN